MDWGAVLIGLSVLVAAFGIYFLPGIIASNRRHPSENSIVILNLFLGWTFLGWVVALVWSVSAIPDNPRPQPNKPPPADDALLLTDVVDPTLMPCPRCAEMIKKAAKVCRFCNAELVQS